MSALALKVHSSCAFSSFGLNSGQEDGSHLEERVVSVPSKRTFWETVASINSHLIGQNCVTCPVLVQKDWKYSDLTVSNCIHVQWPDFHSPNQT